MIRFATPEDASGILEIYSPIVRDTVISFELEPPSVSEMAGRIRSTLEGFPWVVSEEGGQVLGYAYAAKHRERTAYRWATDVSVYVHEKARRQGLGRVLYARLFEILRLQGYVKAFAGVTLPNPASVKLHEAIGFTPVGIYRDVGFKHGSWYDVGWWQCPLIARPEDPVLPRPLPEVAAQAEDILRRRHDGDR